MPSPEVAQFEPVNITRFATGLYTQRSPLVIPFSFAGLQRLDRYDALCDGSNVEISNRQTIRRRPGFVKYCTVRLAANEVVRRFYSFRKLDGTISVLADLTTSVSVLGASSKTSLLSIGGDAMTFCAVGDACYMANGTLAKVYDGSTVRNMGITAGVTAPTVSIVAGSLSPAKGYRWAYCYKQASTQHISSAGPVTADTGPQTSKSFQLTGPRSADAQVDKIEIYRIKDGGSVYYYVAEIDNPANGDWQYTDTTTDANLNVGRSAPLANANDPPPTGLTNLCFHVGRMWGSVGNKVYCAAGPDCLNGVPERAWPPLNYWTFPGNVYRLVPTREGLLVFTASDIYIIAGVDMYSFYPRVWIAGVGILNHDCALRDCEDVYVYSSAGQLLRVANNSIDDLGFPIENLAASFPPATTHLTIHREGNKDNALYLSSETTGKLQRLSLSLNCWSPLATPLFGIGTIASCEIGAGTHRLLTASAAGLGYAFKRDLNTNTDNGTSFTANFTLGSLPLASPGKYAQVESVTLQRAGAGSNPTVSVLLNESSGTFTALTGVDDPIWITSSTVSCKRFYLKTATSPLTELAQHLQIKVELAAEDAANEILGIGVVPPEIQQ